jgi:hypothetical protein
MAFGIILDELDPDRQSIVNRPAHSTQVDLDQESNTPSLQRFDTDQEPEDEPQFTHRVDDDDDDVDVDVDEEDEFEDEMVAVPSYRERERRRSQTDDNIQERDHLVADQEYTPLVNALTDKASMSLPSSPTFKKRAVQTGMSDLQALNLSGQRLGGLPQSNPTLSKSRSEPASEIRARALIQVPVA